jgi:hypothetical protein
VRSRALSAAGRITFVHILVNDFFITAAAAWCTRVSIAPFRSAFMLLSPNKDRARVQSEHAGAILFGSSLVARSTVGAG